jgi:predicted porin
MLHFLKAVSAGVAALVAFGGANAQSSVTVYGRVNITVERQDRDGDKNTVMQNNSSRWGLKGGEELGGGLKAGFQIESGFNPSTGQAAGTFWGRQSEVNLGGGFGMLRLGNYFAESYYATADYVSNHNHDTGTSSDALYAYVMRDTSKVAYRLPELSKGLSVEVAAALADNGAAERAYDLAVNWALGDLALGAGYAKNDDQSQFAVRAFYTMGPVGFGGYVQRDKNAWGAAQSGSRTNVRLSGMYTVGSSEIHLNFGLAGKIGNASGSKANQYTLGYNYNLSKRTKLYGFYTAVADGSRGVYGGDFNSLAVGMRHNF